MLAGQLGLGLSRQQLCCAVGIGQQLRFDCREWFLAEPQDSLGASRYHVGLLLIIEPLPCRLRNICPTCCSKSQGLQQDVCSTHACTELGSHSVVIEKKTKNKKKPKLSGRFCTELVCAWCELLGCDVSSWRETVSRQTNVCRLFQGENPFTDDLEEKEEHEEGEGGTSGNAEEGTAEGTDENKDDEENLEEENLDGENKEEENLDGENKEENLDGENKDPGENPEAEGAKSEEEQEEMGPETETEAQPQAQTEVEAGAENTEETSQPTEESVHEEEEQQPEGGKVEDEDKESEEAAAAEDEDAE